MQRIWDGITQIGALGFFGILVAAVLAAGVTYLAVRRRNGSGAALKGILGDGLGIAIFVSLTAIVLLFVGVINDFGSGRGTINVPNGGVGLEAPAAGAGE